MGFELREALIRLCVEIGWSYAVFWRAIGSPTPKHLAWEDGHWYGKLQLSGNDDVNSHFNSLVEIGSQGECSIDELVNKTMVPKVHDIGDDGIVGLAASTGNHQWILRDVASDNASILFHLADIGNQFLAGIQTIVVVPVLPHGVVQFGSTKRVKENIIFVKHVRTSFMQLAPVPEPSFGVTQKGSGQNLQPYGSICPAISDYPFQDDCTNVDRSLSLRCNHQLFISSASSFLSQTSSSLSSRCQENLSKIDAELCQSTIHSLGNSLFHINNSMESGLLEAQVVSNGDMVSSLNRVSGEFDTYSLLPKFETMESANALERLTSTPNCTKENIQTHSRNVSSANPPSIVQDIDTLNGSKGISKSSNVNNSSSNKYQEILSSGNLKKENDLPQSYGVSSSSCNGLTFCPCQKCRLGSSSTISLSQGIESADFYGNHRCKVEKLQSRAIEIDSSLLYVSNENSSSFLPLATTGDDLFDILGLYGGLHRSAASGQQLAADVSVCNAQLNLPPIFYSENSDLSCSEVFSKSNTDQLLDAVVSKINTGARQSLDDNISCKTSLTKVSGSSIYCGSPSSDVSASTVKRQGDYISPSMLLSNVEAASSTTVRSADSMDETRRPVSYKSESSLWVESGQNMKSENLFASHGKRVDDLNMVHRKRQRPGENPRPRPKDRQLIMDRVKELREIVPNGSKCSIDALLEKTIKHMLFLQSVTKHADKLGETGEPKIISEDGRVLVKDSFQGGATWAFEVGSQPITCPIIVEDLNPPREMLVEMLCEEHGFFLEIADLIRGLGLTILKGVMEARKGKIWARFAVEANRDVTRMEIFLSLVRLLEPTFGSGATPHFIHNNNMPHKIFNQSVPAIGISDPLQ